MCSAYCSTSASGGRIVIVDPESFGGCIETGLPKSPVGFRNCSAHSVGGVPDSARSISSNPEASGSRPRTLRPVIVIGFHSMSVPPWISLPGYSPALTRFRRSWLSRPWPPLSDEVDAEKLVSTSLTSPSVAAGACLAESHPSLSLDPNRPGLNRPLVHAARLTARGRALSHRPEA